jgi:uncharacterized protein (TIGR03118 family)
MKTGHILVAAFPLIVIAAGCGADKGSTTQGRSTQALDGDTIVQVVTRTDIVSDLPGAKVQDVDLMNAWGLAFNPKGIAWVSTNGAGLASVFHADGTAAIPAVTIPTPAGGTPPSAPTGAVFNANTSAFKGDVFIFVTEDGTISGWQGGTSAVLRADNSTANAVYKGATIATDSRGNTRLYAANFREGTVEVYDDSYKRINPKGDFRDDNVPAGFAPFNVQEFGGFVYVTFAKQDAARHDDVKGAGNGFVDIFDPDGTLATRLIAGGALNSPWGLAVAPHGFGDIGGRLLVGNFGDGKINVYDLTISAHGMSSSREGELGGADGKPLVIDGLWALRFGVDAGGFSSSTLYFTGRAERRKGRRVRRARGGRSGDAEAAAREDLVTAAASHHRRARRHVPTAGPRYSRSPARTAIARLFSADGIGQVANTVKAHPGSSARLKSRTTAPSSSGSGA